MFTFRVFCDDRKLSDCLRVLQGVALKVETPQPVVNATATGGTIKAPTNGTAVALFRAHVKKKKLKQVTPAELKAFCVSVGRSEASYSNLLRDLQTSGELKKPTGKRKSSRPVYDVVLK